MQLTQSLNIKQKQSLVMTPQLQQAIKLLQLTNLELKQFLEEQTFDNPFINVEEENQASEKKNTEVMSSEKKDSNSEQVLENETTDFSDDPTRNEDYDNRFDNTNIDYGTTTNAKSNNAEDWDLIASTVPNHEKSLIAHIEEQLPYLLDTPREHFIARYFLEALEASGWLGKSLDEIQIETSLDHDDLENVLMKLQGAEPTGLFSRNLSECLKLQILDKDLMCTELSVLLENLALLAKGDLKALMKKIDCDEQKIKEFLVIIRSLDPKPGASFSSEASNIHKPDLLVRKISGDWIVDLNRSTLPSINIHEDYAKKLSPEGRDNKIDGYASQALSSARWLKRALEQRNITTLKITAEIIKRQSNFLEKGMDFLEPLSLKDIAMAINMHESTVSRVTNGLMVATPKGTFPLKSLFSVTIETENKENGKSAAAVRNMIKKILHEEKGEKPLSDDIIAKLVSKNGVKLARRTVAKYREMLNIPSSSERKRRAKLEAMTAI
ncbi:MAG: RNA polymerase factor sigma-54 [Paracoccaceae bacterium]